MPNLAIRTMRGIDLIASSFYSHNSSITPEIAHKPKVKVNAFLDPKYVANTPDIRVENHSAIEETIVLTYISPGMYFK